jgi:Pyruvate/2-oxoacid:ferredoxin oxidoreductase gamma subunit
LNEQEVLNELNKLPKDKLNLVPASKICQEKLGKEVVSSIYLLGYAVNKKLIPLKRESVLQAIKNIIPEKYLELNIKAFELSA